MSLLLSGVCTGACKEGTACRPGSPLTALPSFFFVCFDSCIYQGGGYPVKKKQCLPSWDILHGLTHLRSRQNGRDLADDAFKRFFLNENGRISVEISLKFVPTCPINNIPALDQMVRLPTHICVTRSASMS